MQKGFIGMLIWLITGLFEIALGQNLIPNGSFETYQNCPRQDNVLREATPWYNPNKATPDFYNQCFDTGQMLLPPHSGRGLAHLFFDRDWAEYLAVQLTRPLVRDQCYYFEMWVATDTPNKYISTTLGAFFSTQPLTATTTSALTAAPQVIDNQVTSSTPRLRWQRISGTWTAKGGEEYVTIGSFYKLPGFLEFYYVFVDDISLRPITLDLGKDTTLCGRSSTKQLAATTPGASYYRWNNGSTDSLLLVSQPGKYSVTVTTPCNTLRDSITIDYALNFDLGADTTLCNGQTLTLTVPATAKSTYRWQDGSSQNTYTVSQAGQYSVQVAQANCTTADSLQVRYIPPPQLTLGPGQELCGAVTFTIKPRFADGKFTWLDSFPDVARTVSSSGIYRASVQNDCATVTDSITIDYSACDCVLYTPDGFTPNEDGINDAFLAFGCGDITITSLMVFDRWGEIVFQTGIPPFQWNGYYKGEICQTGVYAWAVQYQLNQHGQVTLHQKQGALSLVR